MKIGFIGNYALGPGGEAADETHLAREIERQGNQVFRIPRDEWREYVLENFPKNKYKVPEEDKLDIVIVAKWHHFFDGRFIEKAREKYRCPVFLWVWDFMEGNSVEDWHMKMAKASNLYLAGELGLANYYHENKVNFYYFQFDSTDGEFSRWDPSKSPTYEVVYFGSHINQNGRIDLLREINKEIPIDVFAYDFEEWKKDGFIANPPVYGEKFNQKVSESKIVLGTTAGPNCYGYWSNRVGKVLYAGGFLLQQYTPGMENFLGDCCEYFSSPEEAIEKIMLYRDNPEKRSVFINRNKELNVERWTSESKVRQLCVLMDRFLKTNQKERPTWMLP